MVIPFFACGTSTHCSRIQIKHSVLHDIPPTFQSKTNCFLFSCPVVLIILHLTLSCSLQLYLPLSLTDEFLNRTHLWLAACHPPWETAMESKELWLSLLLWKPQSHWEVSMEDREEILLPVSRASRSIFGHQFCISKEWSELLIWMGFRALVNGLADRCSGRNKV